MTTDSIAEVGIDEQERLYVRPSIATLPYIYREAVEVHWEPIRRHLHSPKPREWSYLQWFKHIVSAAELQAYELRHTPSTTWINIAPELAAEMQRWSSSYTPRAP
ncbi:MAG TPA: hypothetical protein VF585_06460 [Chthoniobacterales bacterium]|jgi:hypothetical protein